MPQVGTPNERKWITHALDTNFINEGPLATEFEKQIAARVGTKFAIAVPSCTTGIFLALKAAGVKPGDEVIVPDITFIATANAVDLCGAKPILVDIDPKTLTISIEAAKKAITSKTKAIAPVHVTGRAADMKAILALAAEHGLVVVEDAAEALMSQHEGQYLGTFGNAGCFSFSPNKTITTGQGGMIVTNDEQLATKIRALKNHGIPTRGTGGNDLHATIGYNFRMTDLQAAIGLGQLDFLEERVSRMKRHYELYSKELAGVPEVTLYPCNIAGGAVPQWTDIVLEKRDELDTYLHEQNIDCRKYWFPIHQQVAYQLPDDAFPNSTRFSPRSLWLPSAFTLKDEEIMEVCRAIKQFFRE